MVCLEVILPIYSDYRMAQYQRTFPLKQCVQSVLPVLTKILLVGVFYSELSLEINE